MPSAVCVTVLHRWCANPSVYGGCGLAKGTGRGCLRPAVSCIVQLSDLHLLGAPREQTPIFDALIEAIRTTQAHTGRSFDLLTITGDVFDTVSVDPERATLALKTLLERVYSAIGGAIPSVIIPGNHDRRRMGLLGPHRDDLFHHLARSIGPNIFVHGTQTPFLSSLVPHDFHRQPFWLIAYDSTYLPRGLISAGGVLRQEDLLHAASRIHRKGSRDGKADWPVLFLLHHHLVPTPLTDVGHIEASHRPALIRWVVRHLLPSLVANADREELTMTALGSGTALSTLHSLGRAVLVLHGHKHYATSRLLKGTRRDQGDVLIVSAGSSGIAQPWRPTWMGNTARLWPSFNLVEVNNTRAVVQMVSFGWKGSSAGRVVFRPLVEAKRAGPRWELVPLAPRADEDDSDPILNENRAHFLLRPSIAEDGGARWDYVCTRELRSHHPLRYLETVEGVDGASMSVDGETTPRRLPTEVELPHDGALRYRVERGLARSLKEGRRLFGDRSAPFSSVGFMNRYRTRALSLTLEGLGSDADEAFASVTDLGTGLESPVHLEPRGADGIVRLHHAQCPARTLVRIYWPLRREE